MKKRTTWITDTVASRYVRRYQERLNADRTKAWEPRPHWEGDWRYLVMTVGWSKKPYRVIIYPDVTDPMPRQKLKALRNACHDYGSVLSGVFPTEAALMKAKREGRVVAGDSVRHGYIKITGENACHVVFEID